MEGSSLDLVFFFSGKMEGRRGKESGDEGGEEIFGTGGGEERDNHHALLV